MSANTLIRKLQKGLETICKDLQAKEPNFFRLFLNCNETNKILSNTEDEIVFSEKQAFVPELDRAGFNRMHKLFFSWDSTKNVDFTDLDDLADLDYDDFSDIVVGIDDDYNLCVYFKGKDYPVYALPSLTAYSEDYKLPFIGASHAQIQGVCENLVSMGVELSHRPTLPQDFADGIRKIIHSLPAPQNSARPQET